MACQHPRCEVGRRFRGDLNYDQRFTAGICDSLDRINREDWRKIVQAEFERAQRIKAENEALANKMKMPGFTRCTPNDDREIQQRKQEVEAISHEEWIEMTARYSGGAEEDSSIVI